ncbi:hypothetical protein Ahy_B06g084825 [Arachis hypogaea]|uniref:Uncharacterized protein n=1 Tax=Arachis hypogaea TaxID=3818 RepID=A0A444YSU7_ARAHY|nr:hypothetical protein Ahy_B06g084825 [Arachis hypogaea]
MSIIRSHSLSSSLLSFFFFSATSPSTTSPSSSSTIRRYYFVIFYLLPPPFLTFLLSLSLFIHFTRNPTIVSDPAVLLDQLGRYEETKVLVFEATSKLESRNRELVLFYCILLEAHSKRGSPKGFDVAYCYMNKFFRFLSIWLVVCVQMNRSREAEDLVEDLRGNSGAINPSAFELKSIMYGYGSEVGVVP